MRCIWEKMVSIVGNCHFGRKILILPLDPDEQDDYYSSNTIHGSCCPCKEKECSKETPCQKRQNAQRHGVRRKLQKRMPLNYRNSRSRRHHHADPPPAISLLLVALHATPGQSL